MRAAMTTLACVAIASLGCAPGEEDTQGDGHSDVRDGRDDGDGAVDAEAEAEATTCTTSAQCDDGIACTLDMCQAGGVCGHTAVNELCTAPQWCSLTLGCTTTGCTRNEQCDDGVYCDGVEECIGGNCFEGPARDCNDGNPCTEDRCDAAESRCAHDPLAIEGCDSDAGDGGAPFDPLVHYNGRFSLAPTQASACGAATYSITSITFTRTDTELRVDGALCAMLQAPPPVDESFSVTCNQGACGTYTLTGSFSDANHYSATWTATFGGTCAMCTPQSASVVGLRL